MIDWRTILSWRGPEEEVPINVYQISWDGHISGSSYVRAHNIEEAMDMARRGEDAEFEQGDSYDWSLYLIRDIETDEEMEF